MKMTAMMMKQPQYQLLHVLTKRLDRNSLLCTRRRIVQRTQPTLFAFHECYCVRHYHGHTNGTGAGNINGSSTSSSSSSVSNNNSHQNSNSNNHDSNNNTQFKSLNQNTPYTLCFVRHGQSTWNRDNRFIGWTDTPLTEDGVLEARIAGQMLYKSGMLFDEVHTSMLRRSIRTTNIILMELEQEYIPIYKHWRLNERNYGELVGLNKKEMVNKHGKEQVKRWRRSYDEPPPPMLSNNPYHPKNDPRYQSILDQIPSSESLKCTVQRSSVYWDEMIVPSLHAGKTVLIVGHENNLRSLIMRLEDISEKDIINLNIPRAVPLAYRLDPITLKPLNRPDGKLDEATGFLRGEWLGGDDAVSNVLQRDEKQVYDTTITENLEYNSNNNNNNNTQGNHDSWNAWIEFLLGKQPKAITTTSTKAKAKIATATDDSRYEKPQQSLTITESTTVTSGHDPTTLKSLSSNDGGVVAMKESLNWNTISNENNNNDVHLLNGSSSSSSVSPTGGSVGKKQITSTN